MHEGARSMTAPLLVPVLREGQNGISSASTVAAATSVFASSRSPFDSAFSPFGGQITPSQERSRHLKSGALGFRLVRRLSHTRPPHFGQLRSALVRAVAGGVSLAGGAPPPDPAPAAQAR